jgi:hypothetical protein
MIRKALLLLAAAVFVVSAHAQYSAYGTVTLDHMTGIASSPVLNTLTPPPCTSADSGTPSSTCTAYRNTVDPIGFTGGFGYDFKNFGAITLGADARGVIESNKQGAQTYSRGAGTRIYSGLGGIRATFHTPVRFLLPYVEGAAGYGRSNYGVLTNAQVSSSTTYPGVATQNNLEYHVFAGVDLKVLPVLDYRVEVGYGALQELGSYSHSYPLYSVSTGLVFHFPPR